ncbi:MAG: hypothetical protein IT267_06900 [Saprospiraceae bacterium]|nr:hypothetical protein [Saprospiraceae bacterium]
MKSGYILTGIDSTNNNFTTQSIYINKGDKFNGLIIVNQSDSLVSNIIKNKYYNPTEWANTLTKVLNNDVQNGYALSKLILKPESYDSNTLYARLQYLQGPKFVNGEIDLGDQRIISERYLSRILNFKKGKNFNHFTITNYNSLFEKINYFENQFPPRIKFEGNEVNIKFYLIKKRSNIFDFLIGLNNVNQGNSKTVQITGQASIDLYNSFKIGERIYIHYENLQPFSPRLKLNLELPYVSIIPWENSINFDLIKTKDSYINIQGNYKLSQPLNFNSKIGVVVYLNNSFILNVDSSAIKTSLRLPAVLDFNHISYGLEYQFDNIINKTCPIGGYYLQTSARVGFKKFISSNNITRFDLNNTLRNQYDSLNANNLQYNFSILSSYYLNLASRSVIKIALNSQIFISKAKILENEVIKTGGIHSLRGYNDNFFISDKYAISTLEYRFLLDRNSYLAAFADYAFMNLINQENTINFKPYLGFGLGLQLLTKAGSFGIFFAGSQSKNQSFDISSIKVHFGYLAKF